MNLAKKMGALFQSSCYNVSFVILSIKIMALLVMVTANASTTKGGNETDIMALLDIKALIFDDPNGVMSSWNESLHFCMWQGVLCGKKHQRVTELNLASRRLTGKIPPSIGNLSFLRVLDLANNSFRGEVPQQIGHLYRLEELVLANNSLKGQLLARIANCSRLRVVRVGFNIFTGRIPTEFGDLSKLEELKIVYNEIEGNIPPHLGNLSSLVLFSTVENKFGGHVPASLGQLSNLLLFSITSNMISGMIPQSIYNLSLLEIFSVADNTLQGSLPHNVGVALPRIQRFRAWGNQFTGPIPVSFANASSLSELDLSMNKFFGEVPNIFGNLKNFTWLGVGYNDLRSGKVNDMSFITSLTNCSNLRILNLEHSYFGGELPKSIGNLSDRLEILVIGGNEISGSIPPGIGNLVGLNSLQIYDNHLKGTIPATIGKLHKLQGFFSEENELSGEIPSSIGNLTLLTELTLDENNFGGSIPSSMGKCKNLLMLSVYGNSFNGTIPQDVLGLSSLATSLDLSRNSFTGPLHGEVGNLKNLVELKISHNELSGEIPTRLGDCTMLERLYLDHNLLEGRIPESLSSLKGIVEMDLSHNKLVGQIPKDIAKLKFLSKLNLSFNDLYGEMPTGGVFGNVSAVSIAGNDKLCGGIPELGLVACSEEKPKKHNLSLIISLVCVLGVCLMLSFLVICWIKDKKKSLESLESESSMNVSYGELLKATNGFSPENLIGTGSFGSVYKGILEANQTSIAVKVFNLVKRGASRSFLAECETLKNTRHRNLVKVITACSSVDYQGNDFKAIVYELMLNGSLDSWLHPHQHTEDLRKKSLTLYQRLNMAIDVASAVDYLHNRTELSIVHCDLKPSNILLDEDMTAHVGDFGLSRILAQDNDQVSHDQTSSVGIKGTMGYAAPEYGLGSKVSTEGDAYSFGILLLEMFTGKRPTDCDFEDEMNLNHFVKMALPERVMEIVDRGIMVEEEEEASSSYTLLPTTRGKTQELLTVVLGVGVNCSAESPKERMKIDDALKELLSIRSILLKNWEAHKYEQIRRNNYPV